MHRCLSISEVISAIFGEIPYPQTRHSLASLARTCRAFQEPALDLLWRRAGLIQALKTMPDDLWEERGSGEDKKLVRPLFYDEKCNNP
jgi:hypothetical protein